MRLNLSTKLLGGFGVALLLMASVGFAGWWFINALTGEFQTLYEGNAQGSVQLSSAERATWELRFQIANFMVGDDAARAKILAGQEQWYKQVQDSMSAYKAGPRTPEEVQVLKTWEENYTNYVKSRPRWFELYSAGQTQEAADWRAQNTNKFAAATVVALGQLIELQKEVASDKQSAVEEQASTWTRLLAILMALAMTLGGGIVFFISRPVSSSLGAMAKAAQGLAARDLPRLVEVAGSMAAGDLTQRVKLEIGRVEVKSKDEVGEMASSFNQMGEQLTLAGNALNEMIDGLRSIVSEIRGSAVNAGCQVGHAPG